MKGEWKQSKSDGKYLFSIKAISKVRRFSTISFETNVTQSILLVPEEELKANCYNLKS